MSTDRRRAVILRRLAKGESLISIGKKLGISGTRVAQIRDGRQGGRVAVPSSTTKQEPHAQDPQSAHSSQEYQIAYIYGRIESQLEVYASHLGIPFPQLARRISELLSSKALGKVVRSPHRLPGLR